MYEIQQLLLQIFPLLSFYPFFSFSKEQKICSNFHPHRPHSECSTNFSRRSMTRLAVDQLNVNAAITLMRVVVVVIVVGIVFFPVSVQSSVVVGLWSRIFADHDFCSPPLRRQLSVCVRLASFFFFSNLPLVFVMLELLLVSTFFQQSSSAFVFFNSIFQLTYSPNKFSCSYRA